MMNYYVYVLMSETHGSRYVGSCSDIQKRLGEHNTGRCRYTSGRKPWRLIYQEKYATLADARKREVFLKSGQGRKELDGILS
jgi:putative endonuclease